MAMSEFISKNVEIRPKTRNSGENEKNERGIEKKDHPGHTSTRDHPATSFWMYQGIDEIIHNIHIFALKVNMEMSEFISEYVEIWPKSKKPGTKPGFFFP